MILLHNMPLITHDHKRDATIWSVNMTTLVNIYDCNMFMIQASGKGHLKPDAVATDWTIKMQTAVKVVVLSAPGACITIYFTAEMYSVPQ